MGALARTYVRDTRPQKGYVDDGLCVVGRAYASWDAEDQEWFDAALADPTQTDIHVSEHLTAHGFPVADMTIGRHRRGVCRCGRTR